MKVSSGGTEVPGGPETLSSNASPQLPQVTRLMSGPGGSGGRMFLPPSIQSRESGRTGFRSDSKPCGAPAERAGQRTSAGVASSLGDPVLPQASCSAAFSAPIPESPAIRGCSPISQRWSASRRMSRAFRQRSVLASCTAPASTVTSAQNPRVTVLDAAHLGPSGASVAWLFGVLAAATSICVRASRYGVSGPGHMRWISMSAARWSAKCALRSLSC